MQVRLMDKVRSAYLIIGQKWWGSYSYDYASFCKTVLQVTADWRFSCWLWRSSCPLEESCVPSSEDDLEAESDPGQLPVWKRDFSPTAVSNLILK